MNIPWGRMLIFSACIYLLFVLLAWAYGNKVMFPVPQPSYSESENINFVTTSSGNKIALNRHGKKQNPRYSIIYSHGNGEDIGRLDSLFNSWKDKDWEFIAYDYPGYGLSTGNPSEEGCYEAIDTIYQYLTGELGRSPEKIIIWGRSLGTGPSCYLAAKKEVAGLILETPFLSAFRTLTEFKILPWDYFNNLEKAESINCPSLIIHGEWDEVVPFRHGKKLHQSMKKPSHFIEIKKATHNNIEKIGGEKYRDAVLSFIDNLAS